MISAALLLAHQHLFNIFVSVFYFKDSIEANVENAEVHVQQANQQLSRAADYQVISTVLNCPIT